MKFTKMHGIGNDYIYISCFDEDVSELLKDMEIYAPRLCDRHEGIGADGIVLIMESGSADFRMRMFNADGSEGRMCGNASRCVGKYVYEKGLTDKTVLALETASGIKTLTLYPEHGKIRTVRVDMGGFSLKPEDVPAKTADLTELPYPVTCVSVGNPHAVVFMDSLEELENLNLEETGPVFEHSKAFPEGVNTEFVYVNAPVLVEEKADRGLKAPEVAGTEIFGEEKADRGLKIEEKADRGLKVRVWERGSGETYACGTGACAAVIAAVKNGYFADDGGCVRTVFIKGGGALEINVYGNTVAMTGSAQTVYDGEFRLENYGDMERSGL
ncbi:MAG: diaminopimelate epimerase [Oscillospiraceae bacterium]|jgi:diaminopimelate epimerase|nr:diaminopimelate epimerase [Oscillospiraceae bacterium]